MSQHSVFEILSHLGNHNNNVALLLHFEHFKGLVDFKGIIILREGEGRMDAGTMQHCCCDCRDVKESHSVFLHHHRRKQNVVTCFVTSVIVISSTTDACSPRKDLATECNEANRRDTLRIEQRDGKQKTSRREEEKQNPCRSTSRSEVREIQRQRQTESRVSQEC